MAVTLHRCTPLVCLVCASLCVATGLWGMNKHICLAEKVSQKGASWLQKEKRCRRCVGGLIHLDNCAADGRHSDVYTVALCGCWLVEVRLFSLVEISKVFVCSGRKSLDLHHENNGKEVELNNNTHYNIM